jgi:UDP-2,4-diacetamido-2,4,6-trideoxy-beta-L-altropyranose hydrolase
MPKRKIIFRADGGPTIGMGHFIRTLALAEMLKDDFYCIYATQSPTDYQINEIESVCQERIDLPSDETHFNVFLNLLKGNEIVVLDNYYFSVEYQQQIKNKGCKLVCIDDIHDKHFVADAIINHAEGTSKSQYSAETHTQFYLGYKYALLRKDYLTNVSNDIIKKYACLVMMGGADPFNLSGKLISMIEPLQLSLPIAIVFGADYKNEHLFKSYANIEIFKGIESLKVLQLMQKSNFGILPASTVALEASAARLPFICGFFVDNQKEIYNGIETNNLAICIGSYLNLEPNDLYKAIEQMNRKEIAEKIIQKQSSLMDKNSKERFIKTFSQL